MYLICPECGKKFRTEDRVTPSATAGAEVQVVYCSTACKRKKTKPRRVQSSQGEKMNASPRVLGRVPFLKRIGELADKLPSGRRDARARQKLDKELEELLECLEAGDAPGALLEAADCLYYAAKVYFNAPPAGRDGLVAFFKFGNTLVEIAETSGFSQRAIMDACIIKYTLRAQPGNPKNHKNEVAAIRHLVEVE